MNNKERKPGYAIGEEVYVTRGSDAKKGVVKYIYEDSYGEFVYQVEVPERNSFSLVSENAEHLAKDPRRLYQNLLADTERSAENYEAWAKEAREKAKELREKLNG